MPRHKTGLTQIVLDRLKEAYFIARHKGLDVYQLGMKDLEVIFAKHPKQSINNERHKEKPTAMDLKRLKDAWIEFCNVKLEPELVDKYERMREEWGCELKDENILLKAVKTAMRKASARKTKPNTGFAMGRTVKKVFVDLYNQEDASSIVNEMADYLKKEVEYWKGRYNIDAQNTPDKIIVSLYTGIGNIATELYKQNAPSEAYKTMVGLEKLGKTAEVEGIKTIEQTAEVETEEEQEITV